MASSRSAACSVPVGYAGNITFSSAVMPLIRFGCWKMNPKVLRRISVRNRSGSEVISRPLSVTRPDDGRAMQPMMVSRVVLPDPLGPTSTVAILSLMVRVMPFNAEHSLGVPTLKAFLTLVSSIIGHSPTRRIAVSGSIVAARQTGTIVAAV